MRLVVILFAESRELLPRDNSLCHESYGLNGLLEQLERAATSSRRDDPTRSRDSPGPSPRAEPRVALCHLPSARTLGSGGGSIRRPTHRA